MKGAIRILKSACRAIQKSALAGLVAAGVLTAGQGLAVENVNAGPWLPVTNFVVNADLVTTTIGWDNFSRMIGVQLCKKDNLADPVWTPMTPTDTGLTALSGYDTVYPFSEMSALLGIAKERQFFRLRGVYADADDTGCICGSTTCDHEGKTDILPGPEGDDGFYIPVYSSNETFIVYIRVDDEGNCDNPPTFWTDLGNPKGPTQVWPDGNGGWSSEGYVCFCLNCGTGNLVKGTNDVYYIQIVTNNIPADIYVATDDDGNIIYPPTYWTDIDGENGGPTQVWPDGNGGWNGDGTGCTCGNSPVIDGPYGPSVQIITNDIPSHIYIVTDANGKPKFPPFYWTDIPAPSHQVYPDGNDGWTTTPIAHDCSLSCPFAHKHFGNIIKNGVDYYIGTGLTNGTEDVYLILDENGNVKHPLEYYTLNPKAQIWPDGNGWTDTDPNNPGEPQPPPGAITPTPIVGNQYYEDPGPNGIPGDGDDILWRVLATDYAGRKLLITEYVYEYNTTRYNFSGYVLFDSSALKNTMQTWFDANAGATLKAKALGYKFQQSDGNYIPPTAIGAGIEYDWTGYNFSLTPSSGNNGDNVARAYALADSTVTSGKVFALSVSEVNQYATAFRRIAVDIRDKTTPRNWWLRSPGTNYTSTVASIFWDGWIQGLPHSDPFGFRAAVWINP